MDGNPVLPLKYKYQIRTITSNFGEALSKYSENRKKDKEKTDKGNEASEHLYTRTTSLR